jgi:hypothetical protein
MDAILLVRLLRYVNFQNFLSQLQFREFPRARKSWKIHPGSFLTPLGLC